jgi:hypothetical protein
MRAGGRCAHHKGKLAAAASAAAASVAAASARWRRRLRPAARASSPSSRRAGRRQRPHVHRALIAARRQPLRTPGERDRKYRRALSTSPQLGQRRAAGTVEHTHQRALVARGRHAPAVRGQRQRSEWPVVCCDEFRAPPAAGGPSRRRPSRGCPSRAGRPACVVPLQPHAAAVQARAGEHASSRRMRQRDEAARIGQRFRVVNQL